MKFELPEHDFRVPGIFLVTLILFGVLFNDAVSGWDYVASVINVKAEGEGNPYAVLLKALWVPGGWSSKISRQAAHEWGQVVS
jgi:hypothetical protein